MPRAAVRRADGAPRRPGARWPRRRAVHRSRSRPPARPEVDARSRSRTAPRSRWPRSSCAPSTPSRPPLTDVTFAPTDGTIVSVRVRIPVPETAAGRLQRRRRRSRQRPTARHAERARCRLDRRERPRGETMTAAGPPTLVAATLQEYGARTRAALQGYLPAREPRRYLYDLLADYPRRGGKMMRPSLCIATARAFGARLEDALAHGGRDRAAAQRAAHPRRHRGRERASAAAGPRCTRCTACRSRSTPATC